MKQVQYIDIEQAREVLAEIGIALTSRQMKRAADKGPTGKRKLPFFIDPVDGRLKIDKQTLTDIYRVRQVEAESAFENLRSSFKQATFPPPQPSQ